MKQVAQNYSARIDQYANIVTTGIAIIGAVAAAVITVATNTESSSMRCAVCGRAISASS